MIGRTDKKGKRIWGSDLDAANECLNVLTPAPLYIITHLFSCVLYTVPESVGELVPQIHLSASATPARDPPLSEAML